MKRFHHLLALLALLAPAAALETTFFNVEDPAQAPVLAEHEEFAATITVRNPYDRAVRIARIDSSCACAEMAIGSRFLLPHEETELTIRVVNANSSGLQRQRFRLEVTDPHLEVIDVLAQWHVIPDVAVDAVPDSGPFDQRPDEPRRRNVYAYTAHQRPDELHRLREIIRLSTPPEGTPEGGLQVTKVDYAGRIWDFTIRQQGDHAVLVVGQAKDPDARIAEGKYEEKAVIHTNHPRKPVIEVLLYTAIDAAAGKDGTSDPWANMR